MKEEEFRGMLERRTKARVPFIAYWHPTGHGFMLTGKVYFPRSRRSKTVSESAKKTFYNNLIRLRKAAPWTPKILYVVFDGNTLTEEEV